MQDLSLDLLPLGTIVEEEKLDLTNELFFSPVNAILLHLEGAFNVSQKQISVIQLLVRLG